LEKTTGAAAMTYVRMVVECTLPTQLRISIKLSIWHQFYWNCLNLLRLRLCQKTSRESALFHTFHSLTTI